VEVLPKQREQQLVMERHRLRVIAKGREGEVLFRHEGQYRYSAGRGS
jgi:hypothetical protein